MGVENVAKLERLMRGNLSQVIQDVNITSEPQHYRCILRGRSGKKIPNHIHYLINIQS